MSGATIFRCFLSGIILTTFVSKSIVLFSLFRLLLEAKIGFWCDFWWALSRYVFSLRMSFYFLSNFYFEKKLFFSVSRLSTASLLIPALSTQTENTVFLTDLQSELTFHISFFLKLKTLRWKRKLQFWHAVLNFSLKVLKNL